MYLLDANVFIEAANRYYSHDIAPGFWVALEDHGKKGNVLTIDRVAQEIKKEDTLKDWFDQKFKNFVHSSNTVDVSRHFGAMMTWVNDQAQYMDAAKAEFASVADGWIMAYAKHHSITIVTHEILDTKIRKKVPIPNVCSQFQIQHINTFTLLKNLNIKLN